MRPGLIVALIVVILIVLIAIGVVFVVLYVKAYDAPVLTAMDGVTWENADPPSYVNNFSAVPYTLIVRTHDRASGTGTATLSWLEDLGLNEGVASVLADYSITDHGYGLTLTNFRYTQYVGRYVINMPQGPFYFTITESNPVRITLRGHYSGITETLTRV